jgi:dimethylargininase
MPSEGLSYQFAQAVARQPSQSVVQGLRATDRGTPNIERFQAEHKAYISALERAGLKVTVLGAEEAFPDSVFIEDAALCLPQGTVILRPGAPSRTGEGELVATDLAGLGHKIHHNDSEGFIDGGDILVTDSAILVGLSKRTNQDGFDWLKTVLAAWGYTALAVHTPDNVLHFKSDCCVLDSNTILATSRLSGAECFANFRVLTVPAGEEAAANSIRVNDKVLLPAGYPATAALLSRENFAIETLRVSQAALLDGGLSCMSLRF